mmetsp:Transcript_64648/g.102869  ORF Transcript_64648/g.102869 Transcript_64648/m.102869 type:complete len:84 (-) Transcript_64648:295-546(-)
MAGLHATMLVCFALLLRCWLRVEYLRNTVRSKRLLYMWLDFGAHGRLVSVHTTVPPRLCSCKYLIVLFTITLIRYTPINRMGR